MRRQAPVLLSRGGDELVGPAVAQLGADHLKQRDVYEYEQEGAGGRGFAEPPPTLPPAQAPSPGAQPAWGKHKHRKHQRRWR